ncbi:MAG TPA: hypothetical protein VIR63_01185 [Pontiella sp.]
MSSVEVRIVRSPAAFSLPSEMGFSHALAEMDVVTPLRTFSRPKQATSFLEVTPSIFSQEKVFSSDGFLFGVGTYQPALPNYLHSGEARPSARRISMTPELRERLVGGVVLPSELNQESENPWEVRAMVSISEQGVVEHVLLEDPLDESVMNQKVLLLLYNLRFRQGVAVEGEVEIYSPERSVLIERTQ